MARHDDELDLDALLSPSQQHRLVELLGRLAEEEIRLIPGHAGDASVEFNLEPVAQLVSSLPDKRRDAAVELVEMILHHAGKYRLAATLHEDAVSASYAELEQRHEALQASEARYRKLAESLQQQVEAQVRVIESTQQELYESARLKAVGQLAAGLAHEINTPIGFIASNLRVAEEYLEEIAERQGASLSQDETLADFCDLLNESRQGAERIAGIVHDIRTFANIDRAEFIAVDVNELVQTAVNLVRTEHGQELPITLSLQHLPNLSGYPAKLAQALFNALDNAAAALGEQGAITVSTAVRDGEIEVAIVDNGHGMSAEVKAHAFDPFYTTRDVGQGTGLGLCVVRDVVRAHRGRLQLESAEGRGTTLTLWFPLLENP
ncbi:HAMP domain-containing histidine kinase [Halomonas daqingensis]|uniref:histidine kinase n=1 Tax=Billgrantia desiderata TaxID=52021 RepID=A0AAW4YU54_9GAMM|nr:ATP-binding protein [Halomonas desiderata]MCE8051762.1 HAMP domain-containing histidine kinase [Halomonas desiderata]